MALWTPLNGAARSVRAVHTQTDAAPTDLSLNQGCRIDNVASVLPVIRCGPNTFDGTGTLLGYRWTGSSWDRYKKLDHTIDDAAGLTDHPLDAILVDAPTGFIALIPSGIGFTGAAVGNVTIDYLCVSSFGGSPFGRSI